jgi:hypothetical protein
MRKYSESDLEPEDKIATIKLTKIPSIRWLQGNDNSKLNIGNNITSRFMNDYTATQKSGNEYTWWSADGRVVSVRTISLIIRVEFLTVFCVGDGRFGDIIPV